MDWFTVDKAGLAKILERRGKQFILYELVQNAFDQNVKRVEVRLDWVHKGRTAKITVIDDDPDGFQNITESFTLFAESRKKRDAAKRGRFNLGEKLVLALCTSAQIVSTQHSVIFGPTGRIMTRERRNSGTDFTGSFRCSSEEFENMVTVVDNILVPDGIEFIFNDRQISTRQRVGDAHAVLQTETADAEGYLRRTNRSTQVELFDLRPGETGMLYEMGIPVVPNDMDYHVNVGQKVPVNMDRDNVPPAYMREIRRITLERMANVLTEEAAKSTWVIDALQSPKVDDTAVRAVMVKRFGENAVINDMSDPEGTNLSQSQGRPVIYGGNLTAREWEHVKRTSVFLPAGQVTPSPKPFSPDGRPLKYLPPEKWTPAIRAWADAVENHIAPAVLGFHIRVMIANDMGWHFGGCYGGRSLTVNLARFGHRFFDEIGERQVDFLIHEFGHEDSGNHLSSEYHDALTKYAGRFVVAVADAPSLIRLRVKA